jgi:hypothetical protein
VSEPPRPARVDELTTGRALTGWTAGAHVPAVQLSSLPLDEWHYMRTNEDGLRPVAASTPTRMPAGGEAVGTLFRIIHCGQRRRSSLQLVPAQQVGRPLTAN